MGFEGYSSARMREASGANGSEKPRLRRRSESDGGGGIPAYPAYRQAGGRQATPSITPITNVMELFYLLITNLHPNIDIFRMVFYDTNRQVQAARVSPNGL